MKKIFISILVASLIVFGISYWYSHATTQTESGFVIRDFVYDKDHQQVDDLFHKGDNWYWMISTQGTNTYSIDFTLKYATSSQYAKQNDLVMKVATLDGVFAGFLAYYPKSAKAWQLLFLIVEQDFRRQGIARKLLNYALEDMVKRGVMRIDIYTRNNNFKAQDLYKSIGAKIVNEDTQGVYFSWYKPN